MTQDTRIALFLMGELVAALRANDPDAFRALLPKGCCHNLRLASLRSPTPSQICHNLTSEQ